MVKTDADLFKKEAELYFRSLSEINNRFKVLEDLKEVAEGKIQSLQEQVEAMKNKLTIQEKGLEEFKAQEGESWASKKEKLFQSAEFYDLPGIKLASFLEKGFKGAIAQFKEAAYSPEGVSLDFLDIQKVLNDIPDEV